MTEGADAVSAPGDVGGAGGAGRLARFETKVPPLVWMLLAGGLVWAVDRLDLDGSPLDGTAGPIVGVALGVAGVGTMLAGLREFARARTTVDPHAIHRASSLVTGGIYRFTRNPMYLGMIAVLAGWSAGLGTIAGFVVAAVAFVAVMTVLQIRPEERMLTATFGHAYVAYRSRVRRWL